MSFHPLDPCLGGRLARLFSSCSRRPVDARVFHSSCIFCQLQGNHQGCVGACRSPHTGGRTSYRVHPMVEMGQRLRAAHGPFRSCVLCLSRAPFLWVESLEGESRQSSPGGSTAVVQILRVNQERRVQVERRNKKHNYKKARLQNQIHF